MSPFAPRKKRVLRSDSSWIWSLKDNNRFTEFHASFAERKATMVN